MHTWNVILVKRYTFPRPRDMEFQIQAESLVEATAKAEAKIKVDYAQANLKINSIYWLDPKALKEHEEWKISD